MFVEIVSWAMTILAAQTDTTMLQLYVQQLLVLHYVQ